MGFGAELGTKLSGAASAAGDKAIAVVRNEAVQGKVTGATARAGASEGIGFFDHPAVQVGLAILWDSLPCNNLAETAWDFWQGGEQKKATGTSDQQFTLPQTLETWFTGTGVASEVSWLSGLAANRLGATGAAASFRAVSGVTGLLRGPAAAALVGVEVWGAQLERQGQETLLRNTLLFAPPTTEQLKKPEIGTLAKKYGVETSLENLEHGDYLRDYLEELDIGRRTGDSVQTDDSKGYVEGHWKIVKNALEELPLEVLRALPAGASLVTRMDRPSHAEVQQAIQILLAKPPSPNVQSFIDAHPFVGLKIRIVGLAPTAEKRQAKTLELSKALAVIPAGEVQAMLRHAGVPEPNISFFEQGKSTRPPPVSGLRGLSEKQAPHSLGSTSTSYPVTAEMRSWKGQQTSSLSKNLTRPTMPIP